MAICANDLPSSRMMMMRLFSNSEHWCISTLPHSARWPGLTPTIELCSTGRAQGPKMADGGSPRVAWVSTGWILLLEILGTVSKFREVVAKKRIGWCLFFRSTSLTFCRLGSILYLYSISVKAGEEWRIIPCFHTAEEKSDLKWACSRDVGFIISVESGTRALKRQSTLSTHPILDPVT